MTSQNPILEALRDAAEKYRPAMSFTARKLMAAAMESENPSDLAAGIVTALHHEEAAQAASKSATEGLREHLLLILQELPARALPIRTRYASAALVDVPPQAMVTDESLIPPSLMVQPPPRPDLGAITKALRAGGTVPGAVLRNSRQTLRITPVKEPTK